MRVISEMLDRRLTIKRGDDARPEKAKAPSAARANVEGSNGGRDQERQELTVFGMADIQVDRGFAWQSTSAATNLLRAQKIQSIVIRVMLAERELDGSDCGASRRDAAVQNKHQFLDRVVVIGIGHRNDE